MLDSLTPGQFEESYYYHQLEPWGDDWERSSLIAARTINSIREIAAGFGGKGLDEKDAIEDDAFVKKIRDKKPKQKKLGLAESKAALRGMTGV